MASKEPEIDTLFATPPERFVAVRKELAEAAREKGKGDLAIRIKSMKRPSPVVWLANALAREHGDEIGEVLDAGGEIRKAYASGEVDRVRQATQRRQQAIAAVLRLARAIRADAGATERKLARLLLAASIDEPQGELLKRGRLEHEVEPPPLEGLLGTAPKLQSRAKPAAGRRSAAAAAAQEKAHTKALRQREKAVERAEETAARAEELAAKKRAEVAEAQEAAHQAGVAAREARSAVDEARRELETLRKSAGK